MIPGAIAMLVVWAVWTFVINDAPGWVHLLLSLGVFILIWRIVARGTPPVDMADPQPRRERAERKSQKR